MARDLSDNAWHLTNALFGVALGFALHYTAKGAYAHLLQVRRATQITPKPEPEMPELFTQNTEDAISEETLRELAFSPNLDLSEAARRMVIDRIIHQPKYWATLLDNIRGVNGRDREEESLVGLKYIYQRATPFPHRKPTLRAIVHFLRSRLAEVRQREHTPDTDWKKRSQGERNALFILRCEAEINTERMLHDTELVEKWLAQYPFGGEGASKARRLNAVHRLITAQTDDELLGRILAAIFHDRSANGRKQLRAAGLIGSAIREIDINGDSAVGGHSSGGQRVDGVTLHAPLETPGEHEGEDPEARLRRRRRNTVVTEDARIEHLEN